MADIFISYARADRDRIEKLASALEADGYSVWWDRNIHGGAQFAAEIAKQLDEAETVIVAWSAQSLGSEWVLDEASEARKQNKLIPIRLDGAEPPLGFRQRQAIDFSGWNGASNAPEFFELKASVDQIKDGGAAPPQEHFAPPPRRSPVVIGGLAVAALVAIGIAVFALRGGEEQSIVAETTSATANTVSERQRNTFNIALVENYDDSPEAARLARGLHDEIERTFATNFLTVIAANNGAEAQSAAEFMIETGIDRSGDKFVVDVGLIHTISGVKLWSTQMERVAAEAEFFKDYFAVQVANIVRCAMDSRDAVSADRPEVFTILMRFCEALKMGGDAGADRLKTSRALVEASPNSATAHGLYAINLLDGQFGAAGERENMRKLGNEHAQIALKLEPGNATALFALAVSDDPAVTIKMREEYLRRALAKDARAFHVLHTLSDTLFSVGRVQEALGYFNQAMDANSLDRQHPGNLARVVRAAGNIIHARSILKSSQEQFPHSHTLRALFRSEFWDGDPQTAKALFKELLPDYAPEPCLYPILEARAAGETLSVEELNENCGNYPWLGLVHPAAFYASFGYMDEAFGFLKEDEVLRQPHVEWVRSYALFEPQAAPLRADPRFMTVAEEIGLVDYWLETDRWPDYCETEDIPYDCKETAVAAKQASDAQTQAAAQ